MHDSYEINKDRSDDLVVEYTVSAKIKALIMQLLMIIPIAFVTVLYKETESAFALVMLLAMVVYLAFMVKNNKIINSIRKMFSHAFIIKGEGIVLYNNLLLPWKDVACMILFRQESVSHVGIALKINSSAIKDDMLKSNRYYDPCIEMYGLVFCSMEGALTVDAKSITKHLPENMHVIDLKKEYSLGGEELIRNDVKSAVLRIT